MKKGRIALICACVMMVCSVTACSSKEDISKINMENSEHNETKQNEPEKNDAENANNYPTANAPDDASINNGKSSQELFSNTKLQGSVAEFSDSELSLSMAITTTDENGGEVMAEASPGMENEEELVHVTYGENMKVRILTMNRASKTQISLENADKESIKKQTSVLIFGSCEDTYHWTADEVVVVRWQ